MLKPYFETQIGKKIRRKKVTGERFFTETYARLYIFEVIWVNEEKVCFKMMSMDITPSGFPKSGRDIDFGEVTASLKDMTSVDTILERTICKKDSSFIAKYFTAVGNK